MSKQEHRKKRGYAILPREDGRWLLTRDGTPPESRVFASLTEAVEAGRKLARKERVPLKVFKEKRVQRGAPGRGADSNPASDSTQEPH